MVCDSCDTDPLIGPECHPSAVLVVGCPQGVGEAYRQVAGEDGLSRDGRVGRHHGERRTCIDDPQRQLVTEMEPLGMAETVEHDEQDSLRLAHAEPAGEVVPDAMEGRRPARRAREHRSVPFAEPGLEGTIELVPSYPRAAAQLLRRGAPTRMISGWPGVQPVVQQCLSSLLVAEIAQPD